MRRGDFTLKSGAKSTWFIDSKQTICAPEVIVDVATRVLAATPAEHDGNRGTHDGRRRDELHQRRCRRDAGSLVARVFSAKRGLKITAQVDESLVRYFLVTKFSLPKTPLPEARVFLKPPTWCASSAPKWC